MLPASKCEEVCVCAIHAGSRHTRGPSILWWLRASKSVSSSPALGTQTLRHTGRPLKLSTQVLGLVLENYLLLLFAMWNVQCVCVCVCVCARVCVCACVCVHCALCRNLTNWRHQGLVSVLPPRWSPLVVVVGLATAVSHTLVLSSPAHSVSLIAIQLPEYQIW